MSTTAADNFSTLPTEVGRAQIEYPFKKNGDRTTRIVKRTYKQLAGNFTPTALGSPDVQFSNHYLIEESDPQPTQTGLEMFTRTYATIPTTQTVPSSIILSKPSLSGTFPQAYGDFRIFQPDTTLAQYDAYQRQTVTSDSGVPQFYPTGGTYTITFAGSTTGAIVYNASAATVSTALNLLTPISNRGGVVVTGDYNVAAGFLVTFGDYAQITIDPALLTGGTMLATNTLSNAGYSQNVGAATSGTKLSVTVDVSALVGDATPVIYSTNYADGGSLPLISNLCRVTVYIAGIYSITGGTYTITIGAYTTGAISWDANLTDIQNAIDAVAPGLFIAQPWETSAYGTGGAYTDPTGSTRINFSIYFVGSAATGGTFTLTAFGSTTAALAYNASAATVQTALNGITAVSNRGNCTVSGVLSSGYAITFANAVFTGSATSLTPSPITLGLATTDGGIGKTQYIRAASSVSTRDIYIASHGISTGGAIYIRYSNTYFGPITNYTIPDANTIRINVASSDSFANAATITEAGTRLRYRYEPGTASVRVQRISEFYLPGVSSGIATASDIPLPTNQSDGVAFLSAVLVGSGTINYQVGELTQWRDGPILGLTKTTINAADV